MKVYTKKELCDMPFTDYVLAIADVNREAISLGIEGPHVVLCSVSRLFQVLELQQLVLRKQANMAALDLVNASMMSLLDGRA